MSSVENERMCLLMLSRGRQKVTILYLNRRCAETHVWLIQSLTISAQVF